MTVVQSLTLDPFTFVRDVHGPTGPSFIERDVDIVALAGGGFATVVTAEDTQGPVEQPFLTIYKADATVRHSYAITGGGRDAAQAELLGKPTIAQLPSGLVMVIWRTENGLLGGGPNIIGFTYDPDTGTVVDDDIVITSSTTAQNPVLAGSPQGAMVLYDTNNGLVGQRLDDFGNNQGVPVFVYQNPSTEPLVAGSATIEAGQDGEFVVAYSHERTFQAGLSQNFEVLDLQFNELVTGAVNSSMPTVTVNDANQFSISGERGSNGRIEIFGRSRDGLNIVVSTVIEAPNAGYGTSLTTLNGEITLAAFESSTSNNIILEAFDASGNQLFIDGFEARSLAGTTEREEMPKIVAFGPDLFVIAYQVDTYQAQMRTYEMRQVFQSDLLPDTFSGTDGNNVLIGNGGADVISGLGGDDEVFGGSENDTLFGDDGLDFLSGGTGNDDLFGWTGEDRLEGDEGDDRLFGQGDDDVLFGWTGRDELYGDDGNDRLYGQDGEDVLFGWLGDDRLIGGAGNDVMDGQGGADTYIFDLSDMNDGGLDIILAHDPADIYAIKGNPGQVITYHTFNGSASIDINLTGGGVFVIDVIGSTEQQLLNQVQFF